MYIINRTELQTIIRYIVPRNLLYYQHVFIHKSCLKNYKKKQYTFNIESNERLEFLGDSILNMIIGELLYTRFPLKNEGFLTKLRIKIVNGKTLTFLAKQLKINDFLKVSNNTSINDKMLENAFEALLGAIFLDFNEIGKGYSNVKLFISKLIEDELDMETLTNDDNYKDILLKHTQQLHIDSPIYTVKELSGLSHKPLFTMTCTITTKEGTCYTAEDTDITKKGAEQKIAACLLKQLGLHSFLIN